jgi:hypothetical protein
MATVGVLVANMTGKTIKETTTQYRKEQAILLAKSYTEFAIMAVTANDRTIDCIEDIKANNIIANDNNGQGYEVNTKIYYIGKDSSAHLVGNCSNTRILASDVTTDGSDLQIIVDVYVKYRDLDRVDGGLTDKTDWITYHRRTLQKI